MNQIGGIEVTVHRCRTLNCHELLISKPLFLRNLTTLVSVNNAVSASSDTLSFRGFDAGVIRALFLGHGLALLIQVSTVMVGNNDL